MMNHGPHKLTPAELTLDAVAAHYRIRNWDDHFENNRTRDMKSMAWVPVPNKHDGEGFQRIMREPDGITIYGCWHLILQVASKCLRNRGTLLRDDGTPLTADTIALKTGWRTVADFERAFAFLSSPQVAWLELVTTDGKTIPHPPAEIPHPPARKGIELKGTEMRGIEDTPLPPKGGDFPAALMKSEQFSNAWDEWTQYRKDIKKKQSPLSVKKQLAMLAELGEERAVACINYTIRQGWTGLREQDAASNPQSTELHSIFDN